MIHEGMIDDSKRRQQETAAREEQWGTRIEDSQSVPASLPPKKKNSGGC
ncbi:MAG: hypothetical protein P8K66_08665 [Planctomycetota bacterium]|nr:hypothetical protein [Planctomycetota bacterium]